MLMIKRCGNGYAIIFLSFSTVEDIPEYYFKENKTIIGKVVAVHDGDGFRLFHEEENGLISCFSPKKAAFTRGFKINFLININIMI